MNFALPSFPTSGAKRSTSSGAPAAASQAAPTRMTSFGFELPDLGFTPRPAKERPPAQVIVHSVRCKVLLKSVDKRIGKLHDKNGAITIFAPDPQIKVNVTKYQITFKLADPKFHISLHKDNEILIKDGTKNQAILTFKKPQRLYKTFAAIYLLIKKDKEKYIEIKKGEGHVIDDRDDYDVEITRWKMETPTQLGELIEERNKMPQQDVKPEIEVNIMGMQTGGVRVMFTPKKAILFEITEVREFRPRVRTPLIYQPMVELEKSADNLMRICENAILRRRIQRSLMKLKRRYDDLAAAVDKNAILIADLLDEERERNEKLEETLKARQHVDLDVSQQQLQTLKEKSQLTDALNATKDKAAEFELLLMKQNGEKEYLAKCIAASFVAICTAVTDSSEGNTIMQRLESVRTQIAEAVYL